MKHMIPLLVGSFILVNAVGGYLNADHSMAGTTIARADFHKTHDRSQLWRLARQATYNERKD